VQPSGSYWRIRGVLWLVAGWALAVLGISLAAIAVMGNGASPGVGPLLADAALVAGGIAVLIRASFARVIALAVSLLWGTSVAVIALSPWRGLTPPGSQALPPLDPGLVGLAIGLFAIAILVLAGDPGRGQPRSGPGLTTSDGAG